MRVWVRLLPPFGDGKTWHGIDLPAESGVQQLIERLREIQPQIGPYLRHNLEETFHQFILFRDDHVLSGSDFLEQDDRIVIVMPLTGG